MELVAVPGKVYAACPEPSRGELAEANPGFPASRLNSLDVGSGTGNLADPPRAENREDEN